MVVGLPVQRHCIGLQDCRGGNRPKGHFSALFRKVSAIRAAAAWLTCGSLAGAWFAGAAILNAEGQPITTPAAAEDAAGSTAPPPAQPTMTIREYRIVGTTRLPRLDVETAVYPYLGPERTSDDVEKARAALQKAYQEKGFETVVVQIPEQTPRRGIVVLQAVERTIGRLRVNGARYFLPSQVRRKAPSLRAGIVPNFNDVKRDIVALNRWPDRKVVPKLTEGSTPDTVDIELNVEDKLPLHGSFELNNRYSPDTSHLRFNGSISYNNLWQAGHSAGFSFQIAPERLEDARVFSAYYIARFEDVDWLSLLLTGTKQDSNVSTLGGLAVAGRGEIVGARAIFALPGLDGTEPGSTGFFQSVNVGMDYKHFKENVLLNGTEISTPIHYYPASISYGGTWSGKGHETELNAGLNFHFRRMGSEAADFDAKRYNTDGAYMYFRGDLSHEHDLPGGFQLYAKVQGQLADRPLINSEQFSGGGLGSVRGYPESAALGDNGIAATLELRSPSLIKTSDTKRKEWRVYAFLDAARLTLNDPLPEQQDVFDLYSIGVGTNLRLFDHFNASLDLGIPQKSVSESRSGNPELTFRIWTDF